MSKVEADGLKAITTSKLKEWGLLREQIDTPYIAGSINWTRKVTDRTENLGSINYVMKYEDNLPSQLELDYKMVESGEPRTYQIVLTDLPCNYGGIRWYFKCPKEDCQKRCTKLYFLNTYFHCIKCTT